MRHVVRRGYANHVERSRPPLKQNLFLYDIPVNKHREYFRGTILTNQSSHYKTERRLSRLLTNNKRRCENDRRGLQWLPMPSTLHAVCNWFRKSCVKSILLQFYRTSGTSQESIGHGGGRELVKIENWHCQYRGKYMTLGMATTFLRWNSQWTG